MMLRDFAVTAVILLLIPLSFLRPYIGVLAWTWIGYMSPHRLTYGFAYNAPFALLVSIATLGGLAIGRDRVRLPWNAETVLTLVLWFVFLMSTVAGAIYPDQAWTAFEKVSKVLLMTFVSMALMRTRERLLAMLGVVAFSLGFFGLKGGLWAVVTGGQNMVLGPAGSFIGGNTEIALALNMNLPILVYLRRQVTRPWLRHLMLATFLFSIVAIIITYSRGGFLGLIAVLGYLTLRSRRRLLTVFLLVVGLVIAADLVPAKWTERMHTIKTYEEDQSAMGRIHAWEFAMRIAEDRPLLGGGFRCFTSDVQMRYMPESLAGGFDAHNIFFQILGEHGYTGLLVYCLLVVTTLFSLNGILRRTRRRPDLAWARDVALMLQCSLFAYIVSGFFLSLSYFDLFFLLIASTVVLKQIVSVAVRAEAAPVPASPALVPAP